MTKSVLLVEDEPILAMALEDSLADSGYQVRIATSGSAAVAALESGDPFDVIITDIRLPELDGWKVARRARELRPEMTVIFMTGDSAADHLRLGVSSSVMLQKPFLPHVLVEAISCHL